MRGEIPMQCIKSKYLIGLYLDKSINSHDKNDLFNHINTCKNCKTYFEQATQSDNSLKQFFKSEKLSDEVKDKIMDKICTTEMNKPKKTFKWKLASSAAILALVMIIPINGKSAFASVTAWVDNIFIKQNGLSIKVSKEASETFHKEIDSIENDPPIEDNSIVENNTIKPSVLKNIEDVRKLEKSTKNPLLSPHIFNGLSFSNGDYYNHSGLYIVNLYYKDKINSNNHMDCTVLYREKPINNYDYDEKYSDDAGVKLKEISLLGSKGFLLSDISNSSSNKTRYYLKMFHHSKSAEIDITLYYDKNKNMNEKAIEEELLKTAESLLQEMNNTIK